jgi:hypothetical protein
VARPSSIRRQTPEVREAIGAWRREGRTLEEILRELEETYGVTLSRSALHRHVQGMEKALERIERSRRIAEAAVARFGKEPESKTARANIELMQAAIQEILDADEDPETGRVLAKPMDAMLLAKAMDHLTRASRHDAEHIAKIRAEARKEAEKAMKARVDELCRVENLKDLSNDELKRKIAELAAGTA